MNHIEEAQSTLSEVREVTWQTQPGNKDQVALVTLYASMAQAHALIAIAEQLRELNRFDSFRYAAHGGAL